jgi:hypothetical protein
MTLKTCGSPWGLVLLSVHGRKGFEAAGERLPLHGLPAGRFRASTTASGDPGRTFAASSRARSPRARAETRSHEAFRVPSLGLVESRPPGRWVLGVSVGRRHGDGPGRRGGRDDGRLGVEQRGRVRIQQWLELRIGERRRLGIGRWNGLRNRRRWARRERLRRGHDDLRDRHASGDLRRRRPVGRAGPVRFAEPRLRKRSVPGAFARRRSHDACELPSFRSRYVRLWPRR